MASFVSSPSKYADAILPLYVDFSSQLASGEALTDILTTAEVSAGVDPTPSAILDGSPTLAQNVAMQVITGGVVGVIYLVGFNGTTNLGNNLIIYTYIAVIDSTPFQVPV